jgi:hypothetical protein
MFQAGMAYTVWCSETDRLAEQWAIFEARTCPGLSHFPLFTSASLISCLISLEGW